jgi:PncC family amidohydrolase
MAEGGRSLHESWYGVGITGIAGPTGGTPEKPIGLVYISVAAPVETLVERCLFRGSREDVKNQAAQKSLDMLRRLLLKRRHA